jgi:hypothetical protein
MDNISMETTEKSLMPNLNDVKITNENEALNMLVSFLHIAQKRGVFNLQESAKIWECVQMFMKKV